MTNDNYATDKWLKDMFEGWYDPCPLNDNPKEDGLIHPWIDQTFVNPPYSNPLPWVRKAIEQNLQNKRIVMLLKMDTSTRWFKELQEAGAHFLWVNKRLKHRTGKACAFPSMLAVLEKNENKI